MSTPGFRIPALTRPGALPTDFGGPAILLAILLGATGAAYVAVEMPDAYRLTLALALALNLVVLGMKWPRAAAVAALLFLPFLGLIRRLLIFEVEWSSDDPLVVVGPIVALFLFYRLYVLERRRLTNDLMSKLVLGLIVLCLVQIINPFGSGGVLANIGGLFYLAVPLLWFFIGRAVGTDETIRFLMQAVIVVATIAAAYGIWQTEFDHARALPSWDQEWFEVAGYAALKVDAGFDNTIRAFSTFPSNGEYSNYVAIALVFIFAMAFHRRWWPVALVPLLAVAVFYSGGRATMALAGIAVVILLGVRTRSAGLGALVVVGGIGVVFGLAAAFGPALDEAAGVSDDPIASRNIQGLLHPLDPGGSGVSRWANFLDGIEAGFENPAGNGTGASNNAGRLSDDGKGAKETDNDISDVFLSLGAIGGIAFITIIVLTFRTVFRRYAVRPSWMLFGVMGALIVMFGNWLNGGMYALSALTWFLIGWATRPEDELEGGEEEPAQVATEPAREQQLARA